MKRTVLSLTIAGLAPILASCSDGGLSPASDPTSTASEATSISATRPPTTAPTSARDVRYGTLESLRRAVEAAGVDCSTFGSQGLALSYVADAGTCRETPIIMLTFATEGDLQRNIDLNAKIFDQGTSIYFRLVGPNWIIDVGMSDSPTTPLTLLIDFRRRSAERSGLAVGLDDQLEPKQAPARIGRRA
jgi:hypothetical protein